jgi:hypothetical protein
MLPFALLDMLSDISLTGIILVNELNHDFILFRTKLAHFSLISAAARETELRELEQPAEEAAA